MAAVTKSVTSTCGEEGELRRGPWTIEEDTLLIHYIAHHGEGQWNILAKQAGLKRTGKSCRLRWLNYLKPDVKRGNLTLQEQLLILELHSKWGNRWSRIAQQLPGRTDNEIKNYWRTRVQKQARQLKIESNGKRFFDAIRYLWRPSMPQEMDQKTSNSCNFSSSSDHHLHDMNFLNSSQTDLLQSKPSVSSLQPLSSTSNHGCENQGLVQRTETHQWPSDEVGNSLHKTQLLDGDFQVETCSYDMVGMNKDTVSSMGTWGISEFDSQMAACDWLLEYDMAENYTWNLDEME